MKKELKIYLASPRGFCAGVKRAIEIVEKSINKFGSPVYVRHEIVHNKHVFNIAISTRPLMEFMCQALGLKRFLFKILKQKRIFLRTAVQKLPVNFQKSVKSRFRS